MNSPIPWRELGVTRQPWPASFTRIYGSASAWEKPALSLSMIAAGAPAGATSPTQAETSNQGNPDSAIVGVSANAGSRVADVTASARRAPLLR